MQWPLQMVVFTGWHLEQPSFSRDTVWLISWQGGRRKASADWRCCSLFFLSRVHNILHKILLLIIIIMFYFSWLTKYNSFFVIKVSDQLRNQYPFHTFCMKRISVLKLFSCFCFFLGLKSFLFEFCLHLLNKKV